MNVDEFCMNMKKWWKEEDEAWEKIRCCWLSMVYNGPAIEWLKQYQQYLTLKNKRKGLNW
jgi:hypothetical protein